MGISDFWLNGAYLGQNFSGYTAIDFDVTGIVRTKSEGINALVIKVDTERGHEGWWYEGAGIYKNVWLEFQPEVQIVDDSLVVTTKELTANQAVVKVQFALLNNGGEAKAAEPVIEIFGKSHVLKKVHLAVNQEQPITAEFSIAAPKLWTPETPKLYQVSNG